VTEHWKAPQGLEVAVVQAPLPSQFVPSVKVFPSALHDPVVQTWLLPTLLQAPLPSQLPSFPHWLVLVSSAHVSWGSLPTLTGPQLPSSRPVNLLAQALQPVHSALVLLQQNPSTQLPFAHSAAAVHALPTGTSA
jgi:hypothetical protein